VQLLDFSSRQGGAGERHGAFIGLLDSLRSNHHHNGSKKHAGSWCWRRCREGWLSHIHLAVRVINAGQMAEFDLHYKYPPSMGVEELPEICVSLCWPNTYVLAH
jgi:hypothetical protein